MSVLLLALALAAQSPTALDRSRGALADADFEGALTFAEAAEVEAADRVALGEVYRQQGLVREVLGRADHALIAFVRAIRCDPTLELDKRSTKRSTVELFTLARAFYESGSDIVRVRKKLDVRTGRDETLCTSAVTALAPPVSTQAPRATGTLWPVYTLGGIAIASGLAGTVLGAFAVARNNDCQNQTAEVTYGACDAAATRLEIGANIAWAGAGLTAAGALLAWLATE